MTRARSSFWLIVTLQGGWWIWVTVLATKFHQSPRTYDWLSPGFGHAFAVYIFLTIGFQINYLFLYVVPLNTLVRYWHWTANAIIQVFYNHQSI